jgi:hypothetical protein
MVLAAAAAERAANLDFGGTVTPFLPFTPHNLRDNLEILTGIRPADADAHHVFPQLFTDFFEDKGLEIDDPHLAAWWTSDAHRAAADAYNARWLEWILNNEGASPEEVIQAGFDIMAEFGFYAE